MTSLSAQFVLLADVAVVITVVVVVLCAAGLTVWLIVGKGPKRARALGRAEQLLAQGEWGPALKVIREVQAEAELGAGWQDRIRGIEGHCLQTAGDFSLTEKRFDDALQYYRQAAILLGIDDVSPRERVVEAMLSEARLQFASGPNTTATVQELSARVLALQPGSAEAMFWQALCQVRSGQIDQAVKSLESAHQVANKQFIDPPLYLGALLHKQAKPQDALKVLADANRIDASCPFVAWQMGLSMVAAGGDGTIAARVLQKAVGPKGLGMWLKTPPRAWIEAFPQGRSFVRRLAEQYQFPCPVLGADLKQLIRQGEVALGQAHYRAGNFEESANVFNRLLQESAPTPPVLRGLGLALARLDKFDQAFKHLRAAAESEPNDPLVVGYLALCGAMGKPSQPEDKPKNVTWAIRQLLRFNLPGDMDFTGIMSTVFAEARKLKLPLGKEEQLRLCDALFAVRATEPEAAAAYDQLAQQFPDASGDAHALMYCRAAVQHNFRGARDSDFFVRTLRNRSSALSFYTQHGWDLDEVEYLHLERTALDSPGRFPEALGPDYPARGEAFLLARSNQQEQAAQIDKALQTANVLLRLAPRSPAALDRAACVNYRRGDLEQAVKTLASWQTLAPNDPLPVVRQAVIQQQHGDLAGCRAAIERVLGLTNGAARAAVAVLGARLMLAGAPKKGPFVPSPETLKQVEHLLLECLKEQPDNALGLWMLAAVRSALADDAGLAALAPQMDRADVPDARFHYLAAVCYLAARDFPRVVQAAQRAAADAALAAEANYLLALAQLQLKDDAGAIRSLQVVANAGGASADHSRGLLGRLACQRNAYADAIKWWTAIDPAKRAAWKCDDPLRQAVFLAGLMFFKLGRFEQAAERFKESGKLGLRDKRIGELIGLSYFKAGQKLLFQE